MFRSDQVGSLLRPPELLEARAARRAGQISDAQLGEAEDRAILRALELQREVGIDVCTDGEYRRDAFAGGLFAAVDGFVDAPADSPLEWRGPLESVRTTELPGRVVGGKLRQKGRVAGHEAAFLKAHAPGPFKITMPSAMHWVETGYRAGVTDRHYASREELAWDFVRVLRSEVEALVAEGVPYIQIDAPYYAIYVDQELRERQRARGIDPDRHLQAAIEADRAVVEGVAREGVIFGFHICRGNRRSHWYAQGGYEPIAEQVFGSLPYDRFLLEYDSERAGGFEPLRFMLKGKTVVLGLVSTKEGALERRDDLLRRIEEASKHVPVERLAISPQCGFASNALGNLLTWDDQKRKLEVVVETARAVWG
jgi:5-methyltetrahydropteroyltriglutamate--homocysteine methyltransferase